MEVDYEKKYFFMLSALVVLLAPGFCSAAEEEPHPEIALIDYDGNKISLKEFRWSLETC